MSTTPKWDQYSIKAEVQRKGWSLTGLAKAAGLYESACRQGIIGNSRRGAEVVSEALGIPFRELFPTLYPNGRHNEKEHSRTLPVGESGKRAPRDDRNAA